MRVAIVTGAGTGIGKSAALALLKDGYGVGLVGRRKELLDKTAAESGARERAVVLPADLTSASLVRSAGSTMARSFAPDPAAVLSSSSLRRPTRPTP